MEKVIKKALIFGISGQDGAYLAKFLVDKGYEVWGTTRANSLKSDSGICILNIIDKIKIVNVSPNNFDSVNHCINEINPNEIYNLSGQSSVGLSFDKPFETIESIVYVVANILEAIRISKKEIKFFNAGSCECFGETKDKKAIEETICNPQSPYAIAKTTAKWQTKFYREKYGLFATTGILSNHESPIRPERFVTKKIISTAVRISKGSDEKLYVGNINIIRDWGWAPDYVDAMWRMLNTTNPEDFIIATGVTQSLQRFIETSFEYLNLDWKKHTIINKDLLRLYDPTIIAGSPLKALNYLDWEASLKGDYIAKELIKFELNNK